MTRDKCKFRGTIPWKWYHVAVTDTDRKKWAFGISIFEIFSIPWGFESFWMTGEKNSWKLNLVIQRKYVLYVTWNWSLQIRLISSRGNFQASKSSWGLRRFPRFFKLIRLEFFVVEYLFEFHSGPRGYEETICIFGMEYIFDTFQFLFVSFEIYTAWYDVSWRAPFTQLYAPLRPLIESGMTRCLSDVIPRNLITVLDREIKFFHFDTQEGEQI